MKALSLPLSRRYPHTEGHTDMLERDPEGLDIENETDPQKLREQIYSLRERLELRAIENSALRVALDTIGRCANAQGRRFTIATIAMMDGDGVSNTSILVSDPGGDEIATGKALADAVAPHLQMIADINQLHPTAAALLDMMANLDEDGVLESVYNVDSESKHDDVVSDDIPPFEFALYPWRRAGYPILVGDMVGNVQPGSDVISQIIADGRAMESEGEKQPRPRVRAKAPKNTDDN